MKDSVVLAIASFEKLYRQHFIGVLEARVENVRDLLAKMNQIHSNYLQKLEQIKPKGADDKAFLGIHSSYLNSVQGFNKEAYLLETEFASKNAFLHFFEQRDSLLSGTPKKVKDYEVPENRVLQKDNSVRIKMLKRLKKLRFGFLSLFVKDKSKIKIRRWVPLQFYLANSMYLSTMPDLWSLYKKLIGIEIELLNYYKDCFNEINSGFKLNEPIDVDANKKRLSEVIEKCTLGIKKLDDFKQTTLSELDTILLQRTAAVKAHYYRLGTAEGRSFRNSKWYTKRYIAQMSASQLKQLRSWEITLFSISEDWCFDADLFIVKNKALLACKSRAKTLSIDKINKVSASLEEVKLKINAIYNKVSAHLENNSDAGDKLEFSSERVSDILSADDFYLLKVKQSQTIHYALNEIEQLIIAEIEHTNDKRMIVSSDVAADNMQLSKLTAVHLRELLHFEIQPLFSAEIGKLKQEVLHKITTYENEVSNLIHISEYNFETISSIQENPESMQNNESDISMLDDGKEKIIAKLDEQIAQLQSLKNYVEDALSEHVGVLINGLNELTENEKVGALNIRLIKAKAIRKTTQIKNLVFEQVQVWYKAALTEGDKLLRKSFKLSEQLSKIYSQAEVQAQINNEISVFLSEIANNTEKLPFLYQRLFKLEAIEDGYLYFKRNSEINRFEYVYQNWKKGRFATLAITAEKGAGTTSLINYVINKKEIETTYINFKDYPKMYRSEAFILTLCEILELPPLNDIALFIEELNKKSGVIILEGLQFAYLKKVDGFETLKLLFEVISKTNKSIFWVCSCTLHAWNYLNKAILIEEYFGHVITLGEFSKEEMIDIVKKRHRVSGYNLVYLKSAADVKNKKIAKLSKEDVQPVLEKQYFQLLNSLAKGNLSVAFIFWLRSIKRIEENTLYIQSMSDFNSSFIRGLGQEKLFCLLAILLHDGLDLEGFCKVMRYSPEQGHMKLFQMVDDGLLLELNNRYVINLLLYRSTIDALKARNLLH